jgi:hypothetical protein
MAATVASTCRRPRLFLAVAVAQAGRSAGSPMLAAIRNELARPRARWSASPDGVNLGGVGAGPWVTGAIGDRAGLTAGLVASVAVGAVGLVLVGLVAMRQRRFLGNRAQQTQIGC